MLDIRRCYKCGDIMHYRNFVIGSHNKVQREHFTSEMIKEIWENPIFVIKCCKCFYGKEYVIRSTERLADFIRQMREEIKETMGKGELISW